VAAGAPLRVLLVEDNPAEARMVRELLYGSGPRAIELTHADRLRQALFHLRKGGFEAVLLDLSLPDSEGLETFARAHAEAPGAPIVVLTGLHDQEIAVHAVRDGAQDYLVKGQVDGRALYQSISYAIERGRFEEALRASEARYRGLVEGSIQGILIHVNGVVRLANRALARLVGYERADEFVGQSIWQFVAPEDREMVLANTRARLQGGASPSRYAFRVVKRDGAVIWLDCIVTTITWDGEQAILATMVDVTEQRHAQEALVDSEERFRKLTEASFDGIDIVVDGVVREANHGFAEMFGYTVEEVVGRPVTDFVAPESQEEVARRVGEGVEGSYALVGRRKDGKRIQLEATGRVHTFGGRPGRITALRDVTERRLLEDQFRQAQKMEAVGRLAGGIAHDFNNLLTVITSYSELLLLDLREDDPLRGNVVEVRKAAITAATLTRQLLAFSRQQVLELRVLDLNDIVTGARKMLQRLIGEDVELVTVLAPGAWRVRADAGQVEQVIMNLAVNARDAMPNGGTLTLETANVEFDEEYLREHFGAKPGRYVMLAVSDTGVGMSEKTKSRIFEPFFTTKEAGKGTGLGLATVYGIVKQSRGFIWVYSEEDRGSTFKIYLPMAEGDQQIAAPKPRAAIGRGSETVLLVEDSAAVRTAVRQALERQGYTVVEAPGGATAVALAESYRKPIDLLLTDVVMPEMSGRELAERLQGARPGLSVLFMSGYTDDAVVRRGVLERGTAYIQKPFSPEDLSRKVREVLDTR